MTYTLHHGDCLEVLATLPDCSVDAIVGIARAKRFHIVLPELDYRMTKRSGELQFPCPPTGSTFLDFVYRSIRVKPRIRMPKRTVYLNGNIPGRDEEIVDANESSFVVSDCVLSNVLNTKAIKDWYYRILKFGARGKPVFGYRKATSMTGFFPLLFGFLVGSGRDAFQPSLLSSDFEPLSALFSYHVWIHNNPLTFAERPSGVVAWPRAKGGSVPTLDRRWCFAKRLTAGRARKIDFLTQGSCPKSIGASPRASGLPTVLESLRIGVVRLVADWTISIWFHARIVAFCLVLSIALMPKQWDRLELQADPGDPIARARIDAAIKLRSEFLF